MANPLVTQVKYIPQEHAEWAEEFACGSKRSVAEIDGDVIKLLPRTLERYESLREKLTNRLAELLDMHEPTDSVRTWIKSLNLGVNAARVTVMTDYLDGKETSPCVLFIEFSEFPGEQVAILSSRVSQNDIPGATNESPGFGSGSTKRNTGDALERLNSESSHFAFFMDVSSPFYDKKRAEGAEAVVLDTAKLKDVRGQIKNLSTNSVEQISLVRNFLAEKRGQSDGLPVGAKKAA